MNDEDAHLAEFVKALDPQAACELLGLEHFPHYLAAAANMYILVRHLRAIHGPDISVRAALIAELKAGPHPPSGIKEAPWWKAIEPHLPVIEAVVKHFMASTGNIQASIDSVTPLV